MQRRAWVEDFVARIADHGESPVVRMPLFERVIFPVLLDGYRRRLPNYARWIAAAHELLRRCQRCWEELGFVSVLELLRRALEDDPNDLQAKQRVASEQAAFLRYALHEIPSGVLYGIDGADREECSEIGEAAAELERLAAEVGTATATQDADLRRLIAKARLHARAYADYLGEWQTWPNYEIYLDEREPEWRAA
jgi:hypothetical protein